MENPKFLLFTISQTTPETGVRQDMAGRYVLEMSLVRYARIFDDSGLDTYMLKFIGIVSLGWCW